MRRSFQEVPLRKIIHSFRSEKVMYHWSSVEPWFMRQSSQIIPGKSCTLEITYVAHPYRPSQIADDCHSHRVFCDSWRSHGVHISTPFYKTGAVKETTFTSQITVWEDQVFTLGLLTHAHHASVHLFCWWSLRLRAFLCWGVTAPGQAVFVLCHGCCAASSLISSPSAVMGENDLTVWLTCVLLPPEKRPTPWCGWYWGACLSPRGFLSCLRSLPSNNMNEPFLPARAACFSLPPCLGCLCPPPPLYCLPGTWGSLDQGPFED